VLDIRHVSKTFGRGQTEPRVTALDRVDFHVEPGEFVTVLGRSGCGKSTLLRLIAGLEVPDEGTIHVAGRQVAGPGARFVGTHERGISLVPQDGALVPHLSVAQNVGFGLRSVGAHARRKRVAEVLELVELGALARRRPHELSGGEQQRVALARAIAPRPRIILLDEPFSALDAYLRDSLRREVRRLLAQIDATVVLVTHDQEEALSLGDRVAIMRDGRVIQVADPRDAYYRPHDLELARFLGDAVVVAGEVDGTVERQADGAGTTPCWVSCAFGMLPVSDWHGDCGSCQVMIRPENIRVTPAGSERTTGGQRPGLAGSVVDLTFYGHDGILRVRVPGLADDVLVRVVGDQQFRRGDQVDLVVERGVSTYAASTG
jgi:iron(III) transport system ATP-binding protein